ncbi:MAG: hypothetical protein JWQ27_2332 [Ferruginibacter sp.]|nr:hypothetical protein [Ferruginibacter sp.]
MLIITLVRGYDADCQRAYDTTSANIIAEMADLSRQLRDTAHVSFDVHYEMQDIDTVTTNAVMDGSMQVSGENFRMWIDSIETIQNGQYLFTVYHKDSLVVVQHPNPIARQLLQVDVLDPLVQKMVLGDLKAVDSAGYRKIILGFDVTAQYIFYEMVYDPATKRPLYIRYAVRKDVELETDKRVNVYIKFSNYQVNSFKDDIFISKPYITVQNSENISTGVKTANYQVVNLMEE